MSNWALLVSPCHIVVINRQFPTWASDHPRLPLAELLGLHSVILRTRLLAATVARTPLGEGEVAVQAEEEVVVVTSAVTLWRWLMLKRPPISLNKSERLLGSSSPVPQLPRVPLLLLKSPRLPPPKPLSHKARVGVGGAVVMAAARAWLPAPVAAVVVAVRRVAEAAMVDRTPVTSRVTGATRPTTRVRTSRHRASRASNRATDLVVPSASSPSRTLETSNTLVSRSFCRFPVRCR